MLIQNNELHIWRVDLIDSFQQSSTLYPILSNDEQQRASSFYHKKHQDDFIFTRGVLRKIIGTYLLKDPSRIEFSYNKFGKPFIKNCDGNEGLYFNISHSENILLCIMSNDVEAGIDVEKILPLDQCISIAKQFFTKDEVNVLKNTFPELQLKVFYQIWTRKEAFVKAIGIGLSYHLKAFEVISKANKITFLHKEEHHETVSYNWNFQQISIQDDYEAAIAYPGSCKTLKFYSYF